MKGQAVREKDRTIWYGNEHIVFYPGIVSNQKSLELAVLEIKLFLDIFLDEDIDVIQTPLTKPRYFLIMRNEVKRIAKIEICKDLFDLSVWCWIYTELTNIFRTTKYETVMKRLSKSEYETYIELKVFEEIKPEQLNDEFEI
jgi:hypothetical protein